MALRVFLFLQIPFLPVLVMGKTIGGFMIFNWLASMETQKKQEVLKEVSGLTLKGCRRLHDAQLVIVVIPQYVTGCLRVAAAPDDRRAKKQEAGLHPKHIVSGSDWLLWSCMASHAFTCRSCNFWWMGPSNWSPASDSPSSSGSRQWSIPRSQGVAARPCLRAEAALPPHSQAQNWQCKPRK